MEILLSILLSITLVSTLLLLGWSMKKSRDSQQQLLDTMLILDMRNRDQNQDLLNRAMSKDLTAYQLLSNNLMGAPEVFSMSDEDEIKASNTGYGESDGVGEVLIDLEEDLKDLGVMER